MPPTGFSTTSTPALYLSNWRDTVAIWEASKLAQTDTQVHGPGLRELHFLGGLASAWQVNQIFDYTAFFRDETSRVKYTNVENFDSEAWFESGPTDAGTLTTHYLTYRGVPDQPKCTIARSY